MVLVLMVLILLVLVLIIVVLLPGDSGVNIVESVDFASVYGVVTCASVNGDSVYGACVDGASVGLT